MREEDVLRRAREMAGKDAQVMTWAREATELWNRYLTLVAVGFNADQAFQLLLQGLYLGEGE